MGFFDELKKLAHPYDDEDEFFDRGAPEEEQPGPPITPERRESFFTDEENAEQPSFGLPKPSFRLPRREKEPRQPRQAEAPAQQAGQAAPAAGGQGLMLAKPAEFADAAGIADSFVSGRTIVLDLGAADKVTARRVIDFLSGVAYARGGTLSRISGGIYLVTPAGVNISGEMMSQIESGGLYF